MESQPGSSVQSLKDIEGRYKLANRAFEEWFAHGNLERVQGTTVDLYSKSLADELMARLDQAIREAVARHMNSVWLRNDKIFPATTQHCKTIRWQPATGKIVFEDGRQLWEVGIEKVGSLAS